MGKRADRRKVRRAELRRQSAYEKAAGGVPEETLSPLTADETREAKELLQAGDTVAAQRVILEALARDEKESAVPAETEIAEKCGPQYDAGVIAPVLSYGGATSFEELDSWRAARETETDIWDLNEEFKVIVGNIMADPEIDDKATAVGGAAAALKERMSGVGSKEAQAGPAIIPPSQPTPPASPPAPIPANAAPAEKATGSAWLPRLLVWAKETFARGAEGDVDLASTVKAITGADGRTLLMLHTTNPFQDRDKEIIADAALKEYAEKAMPGSPVDYWHTNFVPGRVVWLGYGEKALFELVEPNDDIASKAFVAAVAANPSEWGCSHRFHYRASDVKNGVFSKIEKERSTILPIRAAANPYTAVGALKEVTMDQKKIDELKGILPAAEFAVAEGFIRGEENKARKLADAGVEHKEAKPEGEVAPASKESALPAAVPPVDVLAAALQSTLAPLQEQLAKQAKEAADLRREIGALQAAEKAREERPRAASFFEMPASRDPRTIVDDARAKALGSTEQTAQQEDPMIASLKSLFVGPAA